MPFGLSLFLTFLENEIGYLFFSVLVGSLLYKKYRLVESAKNPSKLSYPTPQGISKTGGNTFLGNKFIMADFNEDIPILFRKKCRKETQPSDFMK